MEQISETKAQAYPPPVSGYPEWFARMPMAPWGWRELNLFGWPLLLMGIGATLLPGWWDWLSIVPFGLFAILVYFFRDPPRRIPTAPASIVAPADGTIIEITQLDHDEFIGRPAVKLGIFLSLLNVHVNRAPVAGRVVEMKYRPGEFISATRPESSLRNESMWIGFEESDEPRRRFAVRQISGMLARRIVCNLKPNQTVARGEKFGMIKLGSRTELILPAGSVQVNVRVGERVRAGRHIVAHWTAVAKRVPGDRTGARIHDTTKQETS
jgi:phosphatidylserine decarboxylase